MAKRTNYAAAMDRREANTPKPGTTAVRTRPVRITVDLPPSLHQEMKVWTWEAAVKRGAELPLAEVVRELIRRMLADEKLAQQILKQIAK